MSTPDALPTEIALIALLLFKLHKFIRLSSIIITTGQSLFPRSNCLISQLYTTWY
jgi:hypothetical protein